MEVSIFSQASQAKAMSSWGAAVSPSDPQAKTKPKRMTIKKENALGLIRPTLNGINIV
jgi:hypothetical protein